MNRLRILWTAAPTSPGRCLRAECKVLHFGPAPDIQGRPPHPGIMAVTTGLLVTQWNIEAFRPILYLWSQTYTTESPSSPTFSSRCFLWSFRGAILISKRIAASCQTEQASFITPYQTPRGHAGILRSPPISPCGRGASPDEVLAIVKPETVVGWHRAGFRLYWHWRSRPRGGRSKVSQALRTLIRRLASENADWGAPKIHGELQKTSRSCPLNG